MRQSSSRVVAKRERASTDAWDHEDLKRSLVIIPD